MLQEIILGLVQGLTEFLPISSSGHLVIVPAAFGWDKPSLTFDILLHLGTLVAVVAYFRRELVELTLAVFGKGENVARERRLAVYIVIGTIPAAVLGLAFGDFFEGLFDRPLYTCGELVATALILLATERFGERATRRALDAKGAALIGIAQAVSISPGISRSGSTIGGGLLLGLSREEATRFSFLMSIPAIAGAGILSLRDVLDGGLDITAGVVAGVIVSGLSGYLAIGGLIRFVRTHSLNVFAAYLLVVAPLAAIVIEMRS